MSIRRAAPVIVAVALHAALDVLLLTTPWRFSRELIFIPFALPVSQNGLVAIWAATHPSPSYVRCVVLSIGLVATWYVGMSLLPGQASSALAAGWSAAFVVQSLVIVLTVALARFAHRRGGVLQAAGESPRPNRYSLATLFLWTAALTVPLTLMRLGMTQLGWTTRVFAWEFLPHVAVVGVYNGLYAVVVLMSLAACGLMRRWILPALLLAALGLSEVPLLEWTFAEAGGLTINAAMLFAGVQVLILYGTLVPLRLATRRAARQREPRRRATAPLAPVRAEEVRIWVQD
jgi:hypothetical protein